MNNNELSSIIKRFEYYKSLGDKTFDQLTNEELHWQYNEDSNSMAIIVNHLVGNMLSRWTNFLTEDGEKEWRQRDLEFENTHTSKEELIKNWNLGWQCLFDALKSVTEKDLERVINIRNEKHTILEAVNRQLAHYPYHVGQIVFIGKLIKGKHWQSLSIPKGASKEYNKEKFSKGK